MTAKLDEGTCTEIITRYLRPLQARVSMDDSTGCLVIEVYDATGVERLLPRLSGETMHLPVHPADLEAAIGSIRDPLGSVVFDEKLPEEGLVGFVEALE